MWLTPLTLGSTIHSFATFVYLSKLHMVSCEACLRRKVVLVFVRALLIADFPLPARLGEHSINAHIFYLSYTTTYVHRRTSSLDIVMVSLLIFAMQGLQSADLHDQPTLHPQT